MADLGSGLFAWVKTVSALTDLIGVGDACQFYPVAALEEKTLPLIVYEEQRDVQVTTHTSPPTLASSRVSFYCMAVDTAGAGALAEALRTALVNFSGAMGSVTVQGVIYEGSSPSYQFDAQSFSVDATFKFWFSI